ncbi:MULTISPECIES: hypothetical protein [unclassified Pseudomonas]|uniref:hypothetical protein n=1 Tax=unclassified Pseudomonas TaxID=196821 RepID=UPI0021143192|nr:MULTISPECIES: hypothetical protein [unclassified Pseudomonas]
MSLVNVHNEWDPLEEMIVGVATGARVPLPDKGLFALDYSEHHTDQEGILPIGQTLIEAPMALCSRYFEPFAYRKHVQDYFASGANWISAPKPQLADSTYRVNPSLAVINDQQVPFIRALENRVSTWRH